MSGVDELVAFLTRCIDRDEQVAAATTERQPYDEWDATSATGEDDAALSAAEVVRIARPHATPAARAIAEHIARWDPARVLAEVQAKRALLDLVLPELTRIADGYDDMAQSQFSVTTQEPYVPELLLKTLAQPYAGQPGWRAEWVMTQSDRVDGS